MFRNKEIDRRVDRLEEKIDYLSSRYWELYQGMSEAGFVFKDEKVVPAHWEKEDQTLPGSK